MIALEPEGQVIVFTGRLGIPRREAAAAAEKIGWQVRADVSKKTTLLVTGALHKTQLAGHEKSAKQRKAELLIEQGISIKILDEAQFKELAGSANADHSYFRQLSLFSFCQQVMLHSSLHLPELQSDNASSARLSKSPLAASASNS